MSSATHYEPYAGRHVSSAMGEQLMAKVARLGMSPRQQMLNHFYSWYRCAAYDARKVDWDGRERVGEMDREAIARAGFIPPGFYDAGATFPLKFRKPTAPYNLVKVVVDRFTGLLFSERRHPQLRVDGDADTEDFAQALAEAARLWPSMIQARTFGGAMGTVVVGFQFEAGRPVIEVHDPRWVRPDFVNRTTHELRSFEKRYIYPIEMQDPETGEWVQVPHWYRRVVDEERDVLWKPVPVGEGEEPFWEDERLIEAVVEHGFGFCPARWVPNIPVADDIDGDPDCHGIYDMVESIDALLAQANRGILANSDPTVLIVSTDQLSEVRKGNENAIKLTNGDAKYMEASLAGPEAATKLAADLRAKALEVAQCVLEHPQESGGQRTATEIERVYSSMLAKADVFREQYGERCVKPLVEMMIRAARKVSTPTTVTGEDGNTQIQRGALSLPDRVKRLPDGQVERAARKLGPGGVLQLQWPGYFEPALQDVELATRSAGEAKQLGLIDDEHAAKFVAEYYRVEDVPGMLEKVKQELAKRTQELAQQSLDQLGAGASMVMGPGGELERMILKSPAETAQEPGKGGFGGQEE